MPLSDKILHTSEWGWTHSWANPSSTGKRVEALLHEWDPAHPPESPNPEDWQTESKEPLALSQEQFRVNHYHCLGYQWFVLPDGRWAILNTLWLGLYGDKLNFTTREPSDVEKKFIESIIDSNDMDNGVVGCSPRTIILLLLNSVQCLEHFRNNNDDEFFAFKIWGKKFFCITRADYQGPARYFANSEL
jgi:hypothetical protein